MLDIKNCSLRELIDIKTAADIVGTYYDDSIREMQVDLKEKDNAKFKSYVNRSLKLSKISKAALTLMEEKIESYNVI